MASGILGEQADGPLARPCASRTAPASTIHPKAVCSLRATDARTHGRSEIPTNHQQSEEAEEAEAAEAEAANEK